MSRLKHLLYVLLFWVSFSVISVQAEAFSCVSLKQEHAKLFNGGYAWVFTAITSNYAVIQLFINRSGEFILIGIDDEQNACELMSGSNFIFVLDSKA